MQIYAVDEKRNLIPAHEAIRQSCYFCPECNAPVRLRGGKYRQLHFYHIVSRASCHQSGKTRFHLNTQLFLQKQIVSARLEYPFPQIKRIADVFWPEKNIVFEVQCSSIHSNEIQQRNLDYAKLGVKVIWILHDRLFNRYRVSNAEDALKTSPHFFSNINTSGRGYIYDQIDLIQAGKRKNKSKPLLIDVSQLTLPTIPKQFPSHLAWHINNRIQNWRISFAGDVLRQPNLNTILVTKKSSTLKKLHWNPGQFLRALFHYFLENAC